MTHPVYVALDDPLFAARKEGKKTPSLWLAIERDDKRTDVRVSKFTSGDLALKTNTKNLIFEKQ